MMFMLGLVLFGTTVLLPQYVQTVMGYTAEQAGLVLSPGALVVIVMLPIVGRLIARVDARWLVGFGFLITALALFHMTTIYPGIDFRTAVLYRVYVSFGLAFLFVPINTASYVGVPAAKNNEVSAMINLARNLGGSVGISLATTLIARRSQLHQSRLVEHVTRFDPAVRASVARIAGRMVAEGAAASTATRRALAVIYGLVIQRATTLAFIDTIWFLGFLSACMLPLVLLMRRTRGGAALAH
jgi:DHA2 family multidrug resistance protein